MEKCELINEIKIEFNPEEKNVEDFIKNIKSFGKISKKEKESDLFKLIKNWIYEDKQIIPTLKLLFKMSKDGDTTQSFHKYCDNKGPTVTIIETEDNYQFGGFTNGSWHSKFSWENHGKDFVFSINKKKILQRFI